MIKKLTLLTMSILLLTGAAAFAQTSAGQEKGTYGLVISDIMREDAGEGTFYSDMLSFPIIIDLDGYGNGIAKFYDIGAMSKQEESDTFYYEISDSNYFYLYDDSTKAGGAFLEGMFGNDFSSFSLFYIEPWDSVNNEQYLTTGYAVRIVSETGGADSTLSGNYIGFGLSSDMGYSEKRQTMPWSILDFSVTINSDTTATAYITDSQGGRDTSDVFYFFTEERYFVLGDTAGPEFVGFVSNDGNIAVFAPLYAQGIFYMTKENTSFDDADLASSYKFYTIDASIYGDIGIIESDLTLDGAGNGQYCELRNTWGNSSEECGTFTYDTFPNGKLNVFADTDVGTDTLYGMASSDGSLMVIAYADSEDVSIGFGLVKKNGAIAINEEDSPLKKGFSLRQNYPNPFNPSTEISFTLSQPQKIELAVYNILGQKVKTLANGQTAAGIHTLSWDGKDENGIAVSSGVYFYRLKTASGVQTRKMTLVR